MSQVETISVTRAIAKVKQLDEQIRDYFKEERIIVGALRGATEISAITGIADKATMQARIQGDHDRLENLMRHRRILKNALTISNATVQVTIAGESYTVAEAIELKKQVPLMESVLRSYRSGYTKMLKEIAESDKNVEAHIENLTKAQTTDSTTAEDRLKLIEQIRVIAEREHRIKIYDPLNLPKKIQDLEAKINELKLDLDTKLSELNATTVLKYEI